MRVGKKNPTFPFLDVLSDNSDGFSTSVYRKPSFTCLFTNFDSFIPIAYKRDLVYTLLNRYFKICSSYHLHHSELIYLKKLFVNNGCPEIFLERCIRVSLNKLFSLPTRNSNMPDKTVINFSLPFTGSHSLQIRTQIAKLCSSAFPHFTVRFIFQSGRRLSDFFSFKDRIPKLMRSRVIYKYSCQCCRVLYFGQTRRHFHTRISEPVA